MSDSWINGEQVSSDIKNTCQSDLYSCNDKTHTGQDTNGLNYYSYPRKPTPSPNINHYAVLEKPGIHRKVLRGCFNTPKDTNIPTWNINNNTEMITICDDYKGAYCRGDILQNKCFTQAPGGLADFTHPMRALGEDFLDNGFVLDRCECTLDLDELGRKPFNNGCTLLSSDTGDQPIDYVCEKNKRYRTCDHDWLVTQWTTECCDSDTHENCMNKGYEIGNSEFVGKFGTYNDIQQSNCNTSDFNGTNFTNYQPSELWDGRIVSDSNIFVDSRKSQCYNWYNPTIDELPLGSKDKNNCTQYLLKWAHSCKWCKDNRIGTGDFLERCDEPRNGCPINRTCADSCNENIVLDGSSCNGSYQPECNICDSPLWDHIPGGWEALVDESHPQHKMALFSYVPKLLKFKENTQPTTGLLSDGKPSNPSRDDVNLRDGVKNVTNFIGLGPYIDKNVGGEYRNEFVDNQIPNISQRAEYNWVGNINLGPTGERNVTHPRCNSDSGNDISESNKSIWESSFLSTYKNNDINRIETCQWENPSLDPEENPRSHIVCERNPNLTGYGECDEDTDYYAKLWLDGKWDLSKYTGDTELIDEGLTQEQLDKRRLEGLRCCLGLTPDFITNNSQGIEIPPQIQSNLTTTDDEYKRYKYCRPGLTCPSSKACQELIRKYISTEWGNSTGGFSLYKFGRNYPENYSLKGNTQTTQETMEDPTYYIKAYCEMMSGGANGVSSDITECGREKQSEVDCRKLMYNYCSSPVQVDLQGDLGDLEVNRIEYPLRIFTDSCYEWCREDSFGRSLTKALPSQKGVCDMSVGKTCQQLQVDGWIDPDNWGGSKILEFAEDGVWSEVGEDGVHGGLTAERLRNVCGCFLLGSECGNENCSVSYCGAGSDGSKGPGVVGFIDVQSDIEWNDYNENNPINRTIFDMRNVYDFQGPRQADRWEENIDPTDFKCTSQGSNIEDNRCFKGCNYVNFNDTCWMASPEERQHDTLYEGFKDINIWECDGDKGVGDNCGTYNGKYGCFGNCNVDGYVVGDNVMGKCGTDEWFEHRMNINPNEKKYKVLRDFYRENQDLVGNVKPNRSRNWPKWQNFYSEKRNIPGIFQPKQSDTEVEVPGWGSYTTDSNGLPKKYGSADDPVCFYPSCASRKSIRPYREMLKGNTTCGNNCSINLETTINNQGIIVGGIISSLNASNSCNINNDWKPNAMVNSNNQREYLTFMGDKDCSSILNDISIDCSICSLDSTSGECKKCNDLLQCVHGSKVCIDSETGDNCQLCRNEKPNICCLSPNENPYQPNTQEYIQWQSNNEYLIRNTSNYVSYVCNNTCPNGSISLDELEQRCGEGCSSRDQSTCENCAYCTWVPENLELGMGAHCSAVCPLPPSRGWGIEVPDIVTNPPIPEPTLGPTVDPVVTDGPDVVDVVGMDNSWVGIVVVSGGVVFIVLGVVVYILYRSRKLK